MKSSCLAPECENDRDTTTSDEVSDVHMGGPADCESPPSRTKSRCDKSETTAMGYVKSDDTVDVVDHAMEPIVAWYFHEKGAKVC